MARRLFRDWYIQSSLVKLVVRLPMTRFAGSVGTSVYGAIMMTLHKLNTATICEFLARNTTAAIAEKPGHTTPNDTTETGAPYGHWVGHGLAMLGQPIAHTLASDLERELWCVEAGSAVRGDQIKALFVFGLHPNAEKIVAHLISQGTGEAAAKSAVHLGRPFQINDTSTELRRRVSAAYRDYNVERGQPSNASIDAQQRSQIRNMIAHNAFADLHGRASADDHELHRFIARGLSRTPGAVSGYTLTFTPVKSVSVLWALAPLNIAHTIELCHKQAVAEVFEYLQDAAALSRTGAAGAIPVDTDGFIAAQFQHRRRAEDPNLCTHIVVSNKVRAVGKDGIPRWLAVDGRRLYKEAVPASELYNTRIEAQLIATLGLSFAEREAAGCRKRPVREIVGVPANLCAELSSRRNTIKPRHEELTTRFELEHGYAPTTSEDFLLSERAAFETREARPKPCSPAQQRARWRSQAAAHLGGQAELNAMLADALTARKQQTPLITTEWIQAQAAAVIETISKSRSTWEANHVFAEAQRRVRAEGAGFDPRIAVAITDAALQEPHSMPSPRSRHETH